MEGVAILMDVIEDVCFFRVFEVVPQCSDEASYCQECAVDYHKQLSKEDHSFLLDGEISIYTDFLIFIYLKVGSYVVRLSLLLYEKVEHFVEVSDHKQICN